jgi:hypothetical protein
MAWDWKMRRRKPCLVSSCPITCTYELHHLLCIRIHLSEIQIKEINLLYVTVECFLLRKYKTNYRRDSDSPFLKLFVYYGKKKIHVRLSVENSDVPATLMPFIWRFFEYCNASSIFGDILCVDLSEDSFCCWMNERDWSNTKQEGNACDPLNFG